LLHRREGAFKFAASPAVGCAEIAEVIERREPCGEHADNRLGALRAERHMR